MVAIDPGAMLCLEVYAFRQSRLAPSQSCKADGCRLGTGRGARNNGCTTSLPDTATTVDCAPEATFRRCSSKAALGPGRVDTSQSAFGYSITSPAYSPGATFTSA